jgi:hypothetical protein
MKHLRLFENFNEKTFIVYHSTNYEIDKFDFDKIDPGPGSSTRIEAIFFSDIPQHSWGEYVYKVELTSKNPIRWNMSNTGFDSLSVQEAFDALLRQDIGYIVEDMIEYQNVSKKRAEDLADWWAYNSDLIILNNCNYAKHRTEYIVPAPYYNGHSAEIKIIEIIR